MIIIFLTCKDRIEAQNISNILLKNMLIACARFFPIESSYWWNKKIENSKEIMVMMESSEENFNKIEKIVKEYHSYELPALTAINVSNKSKGVEKWLKENLKR